jgi:putative ABC transport system permease protein
MSAVVWNLQLAGRSWKQARLLAATAVGTLALGIGMGTAIFSVASGVLLNAVPWPKRDRAVAIESRRLKGGESEDVTTAAFLDWRAQSRSFAGLAASQYWPVNLTDGGQTILVEAPRISVNSLELVGVQPALGRSFTEQDAEPGAPPVAILSHSLWKQRYGADSGLIGRSIEIDGQKVAVVGILPDGQFFPGPWASLVTPLQLRLGEVSRTERILDVVGVLRPGVALPDAQSEMRVIADRLAQQYPESDEGWSVRLVPVTERIGGGQRTRSGIALLLGAVGFLLLIVCANVANLLLLRGAARAKELATRSAIGASQRQIALQLLAEAAVLGMLALPLALGIGWILLQYLVTLVPPSLSWMARVLRFDAPVMGFAFAATAITLLIFSLIPVLQTLRLDLQRALKEGGGRGASAARPWLRQALAVTQLALGISLLAASGLIVERFSRLQASDPGFDPENLVVMTVRLPEAKYSSAEVRRDFLDALLASLARLPGVEQVGSVSAPPFGYPGTRREFVVSGESTPEEDRPSALWSDVSAEYARTLGLNLVEGRSFAPEDRFGGLPVAAVNLALAKRYFGGANALGKAIEVGGEIRQIVAVWSDYRNAGMRNEPVPHIFVPSDQAPSARIGLVIRTAQIPALLSAPARAALQDLDAALPFPGLETMEQRIDADLWSALFLEQMMLLLSGIALLLAALGVYALVSYGVHQRSQEFAIRCAIGASPGDLARSVLLQAMRMALLGTALACVFTILLWPILRRLLLDGTSWVPIFFGGSALLLTVVAVAASLAPALRAARADSMLALRAE